MAKSVTVDEMLIQLQKKIIKWWEVPTADRSEGTRIRTEAKAELSKLVDDIIGDDTVIEDMETWVEKTKKYGGTREEYWKLVTIISSENNLKAEQRARKVEIFR